MKVPTSFKWLLIAMLFCTAHIGQAQTDLCNGAAPFCTGTNYNFPAPVSGTSAESGPDYGCLGSQPNPVWYYLQIATNGTIVMNIGGADLVNDDIDFACWGPFSSPTGGCAGGLTSDCSGSLFGCEDNTSLFFMSYPSGNLVDCSFDAQSSETCTIPNAITGQYYMILITNYAGNATNIIFNQTNTGGAGAGSTNCAIIPCNITAMTGNAGPCQAGNTFNITGTLTTTQPPSTGTLNITSSCGGSATLNAPFTSPLSYTLTGGSATGAACTLTATYSADPSCTYTMSVTSPAPCNPSTCTITQVTATPGACVSATNTYSVTGSVTFTSPPASGTLTVTGSCGGSQTFTAPFTSPLSYTFTNLPSNGNACSVTATFSADASCTNTANYTAPASCSVVPVCAISQVTATPGACASATNTYSVTGSVTFTNPPATGSLTVTGGCGGSQTFNAPFTSPLTYTFSNLPSDGSTCGVTAVFSTDAACTGNITYTAPASCATCTITAANSGPVCEGQSINLSCAPSGAASYSWTGPNTYTASVQNPSIIGATPAAAGTYTVSAHFPDGSVCTATTAVVVNAAPIADAGTDVSICTGGSVQLTGSGGASYAWTPIATLDNPNIANPNATPSSTTTYTVTVTGASGCTDTDDVTVTIITTVNATVSPNATICSGTSTQLTSSGGSSYSWLPVTGLSNPSISNPVASPAVTTTYSVTVSAGPGCPPDTKIVAVTVSPNPTVTVSPADTICPGQAGVVHAYGAATYLWPGTGIITDSIISNPTTTTHYTVYGYNGSCSDTAVGEIVVIPLPIVEFITSIQDEPGNYVVSAENLSGTLYNSYWTVNNGADTLYTSDFSYDFKQAGSYSICLYGENIIGCPALDCKEIMLKGDWSIYIPNAFSPNADGKNDVFYCYGINFTGFEMQIFDRWGEVLYKSSNVTDGWKGDTQRSGNIAKVDTYIYKVKIVDSDNHKHSFTGQVHLIR